MRARAKGIASGIEAELCVVADVMYPIAPITLAAKAFRKRFPATPLRLSVEVLDNSVQPLLDRRASLGIVGPLPNDLATIATERLTGVTVVMVAARDHRLLSYMGLIPHAQLARHTELVLTDRSVLTEGKESFVKSQSTWRLADLFVKRAFLLAGLGWGGVPRHAVNDELERGRLVPLAIEDFPVEGLIRPMNAAYLTAAPPGPAGRWLIDFLERR